MALDGSKTHFDPIYRKAQKILQKSKSGAFGGGTKLGRLWWWPVCLLVCTKWCVCIVLGPRPGALGGVEEAAVRLD